MKKILLILVCLVLFAGTGCGTAKKVTVTVGNAFKTAGVATGKAAVTAGKATTWPVKKVREAITGNQEETEESRE